MVKENRQNIYLKVKDYSVSGEEFVLVKNSKYGFLETQPQPKLDKLSDYYQSKDYISHTDSKRNFFEKIYHVVRGISLNKKLQLIRKCSPDGKFILDYGCGTGDFLYAALRDNWTVTGVEPNDQARQIANQKTNHSVFNIESIQKLKSQSFDVITLWHVLEHLPNLEDQLQKFKNLLKPEGVLIIAVPNYKSFDAMYYKNFWAAYDVPRHLWHFDKSSFKKLVSKQSFKVEKIKPMYFDSFYVSMLSEKYKSSKMGFIKGFCIGLVSNLKAYRSKEYSSLIYILKKH